jgi:hypothetical protein
MQDKSKPKIPTKEKSTHEPEKTKKPKNEMNRSYTTKSCEKKGERKRVS